MASIAHRNKIYAWSRYKRRTNFRPYFLGRGLWDIT